MLSEISPSQHLHAGVLGIVASGSGGGGGSGGDDNDPVTDSKCEIGSSKIGDCKI